MGEKTLEVKRKEMFIFSYHILNGNLIFRVKWMKTNLFKSETHLRSFYKSFIFIFNSFNWCLKKLLNICYFNSIDKWDVPLIRIWDNHRLVFMQTIGGHEPKWRSVYRDNYFQGKLIMGCDSWLFQIMSNGSKRVKQGNFLVHKFD